MLNPGFSEQFPQFQCLQAQPVGQCRPWNTNDDTDSFIVLNQCGELIQEVRPAPLWRHRHQDHLRTRSSVAQVLPTFYQRL
jgi:hypothetical protein